MHRITAYPLTVTTLGLLIGAGAVVGSASERSHSPAPTTWNARAAERYMDYRQAWWESWSRAARDRGTSCVSCHSALPYALARPELAATLHETDSSAPERKLIADVVTRVRAWTEIEPYYGFGPPRKPVDSTESRGTESVLNALVLASRDARAGTVSDDAETALANMWGQQLTSGENAGAWPWLNFGLEPWESSPSAYFGAALAAVAVGTEPQGYASRPEIQHSVQRLETYLRDHVDPPIVDRVLGRDNAALLDRAMLLWAGARLPKLVSDEERHSLVESLYGAQRPDGGWSSSALGRWRRSDDSAPQSSSDGYATGLAAYALEQAGVAPSEAHVAKALVWLAQHQDPATGMWVTMSLNKARDPESDIGKFMSDAATSFAVLALTAADIQQAADVHR